ncbi:MAG: formylglycine-generating enzyme family protein [Planctomycetota bacterium]
MSGAIVGLALPLWKWCCTKTSENGRNSIGMELIEIPAGKFTMGSPAGEKDRRADEEPVAVTLTRPFMLGKTEVTQGQWKKVMGTEPWAGKQYVQIDKDCPATFVSFFDATEFCDVLTDLERKAGKLSANEEYRLPTEAEWEYACRAGTPTAFSFGDESQLNAHAWWGGFDIEALKAGKFEAGPGNAAREQYAHKVGLKKPNPWGLYDMHGTVGEWCSDRYGEKLLGGADPVGPQEGSIRVSRGGGWRLGPGRCRSSSRFGFDPSFRGSYLGFRVARSQSAQ